MNLADFGPGLWVCLHLPDGRLAIADGTDPGHAGVVAAIRRIHAAGLRSRGEEQPGRPQDWAAVTAWMDQVEPLPDGQLFTWEAA